MVHKSAGDGYRKRSETYRDARPSYHREVVDAVAVAIDSSLGSGITVDLGAGTGISTAALLERGLDVRAVEPVAAMRARLVEDLPEVAVAEGTAEAIPFPDGSAAAVVVAQAFHWFDHVPALAEISRVLAPGGLLITLWNVRDETVPWMAAYTAIQDVEQGDTPRYRTMVWRNAIEADQRFQLHEEIRVDNPQASNADLTVKRFLSVSFIAALPDERQAEMEAQIRGVVADLGEAFDFPYFTEAQFWRVKK